MKGKITATLIGGLTATLLAATPALAGQSTQASNHITGDRGVTVADSGGTALEGGPCANRKKTLHFMGEREANFGGTGIVTLLNCHKTKRKAGIDVAYGPDPGCEKIPYGKTREFEYHTLKGIAEYRSPKWC